MIIDSINRIRELEDGLERQIKEAEKNASDLYKLTRDEADFESREIIDQAKNEAKNIVERKKAEAEMESDRRLAEGELEFSQLKNLSDKKLQEAVDFVLERIVIWYGNS